MKTRICLHASSILGAIMLTLVGFAVLYGQEEYNREILAYITSGVERAPAGQPAPVISAEIQAVLYRFGIGRGGIQSAFPNFDERDTLITTPDGRTIGTMNMARIFKIRVPASVSRQSVIDSLKEIPVVLFAEPNGTAEPLVIPNDPYFSYQWALQEGGGTGRIKAPEAWDIYTGSSSNIVAIVDYGVDGTHPDLSGKVSGDGGTAGHHGTHVAGIASARTNSPTPTGIAGVDWNAQLHAQRIDSQDDTGIYSAIMDAVNYSANVRVLNNSWRLIDGNGNARYSTTVRIAFANAYKQNRVATAAMGNEFQTGNPTNYPAAFGQGIIAVGATDQSDVKASFSNTGNHIDVTAPGVNILSTYRNGNFSLNPDYHTISGTSMATPHVSGIASLLKGYNPNLYNDDIENIIKLSADKVRQDLYTYDGNGWNINVGHGRVNARKALERLGAVGSGYTLTHASVTGGTDQGASSAYQMVIYGAQEWGLSDGTYIVKRHEVRRNVTYSSLSSPAVWGRGIASNGWADEGSVNFGLRWTDVVPGTVTSTSATLRTYVYEVWTILGQSLGWKPTDPANAVFAYTIHGIPQPLSVSMSGPSEVFHTCCKGQPTNCYTWSANVSGGLPPYSYTWFRNGFQVGTFQSYQECFPNNGAGGGSYQFTLRVDVRDAQNTLVSDTKTVTAWNSGEANRFAEISRASIMLLPEEFSISQNFPNPFNPETEISFALPEPSTVRLTVLDVLGREVAVLEDRLRPAGYRTARWNGRNSRGEPVGSGVYFYRITAVGESGKTFIQTMKMLMTK